MKNESLLIAAFLGVGIAAVAGAQTNVEWTFDWLTNRVPVLKHANTGRMPMIMWPNVITNMADRYIDETTKVLPVWMYQELVARGLTQRIKLGTNYLPMARAVQQAGGRIIIMDNRAGNGPYDRGPNPLHQLPTNYNYNGDSHYACPTLFEGWQIKADETRNTLRQLKSAGIDVCAAWFDWEVEPYASANRYDQARTCSRCSTLLPRKALDSYNDYRNFIYGVRCDVFSAYVAGPVREIFPYASVTDWQKIISSSNSPTESWWGALDLPSQTLGLLTAANPVAYGADFYYSRHWNPAWGYPLDVPHMDRIYTHLMMGQLSQHVKNALTWAPEKDIIPWVARYCPDNDDPSVPIMSRERYREVLRHLWLRGTDTMQIFNEPRTRHPNICIEEVEDAVAVYDEMLEYRNFLEEGVVMNTDFPEITNNAAVWSGLRLTNEAVIRAFTQDTHTVPLTLQVWPGTTNLLLDAPPEGITYHAFLETHLVRVVTEATP